MKVLLWAECNIEKEFDLPTEAFSDEEWSEMADNEKDEIMHNWIDELIRDNISAGWKELP